jgi:putative peptidoglycan lipid II flippase
VSILRGTSVVGLLTLASRFLGFIRDLLVALLFGATGFSDAYFVAFRIPNLLRSIFAEGALTSAFVPTFSSEAKKGADSAQRALSSIISALLIATLTVSIIGMIFAPEVVALIAPGFSVASEQYSLCVTLTRVMMPYICFVSVVALLNGALNSYLVFGASAFAQVLMNIVLIVAALGALLVSHTITAAYILATSVLVGGLVQVVAQIPALKRTGLSLSLSTSFWSPPVKETLYLMAPAILGSAVYQITIFLNTLFASLLEQGSISWLFYADRIAQLPLGIFSIALASVLLPLLSRAQAREDKADFSRHLIDSLRYTSFLIIPFAGWLFLCAEPLIALLFQRGEFSAVATQKTAEAVQAFAVGLWSVSCYSMLTRAFIAQKDTLTPSWGGILMLICSLLFSVMLMGPPSHSSSGSAYNTIVFFQSLVPDNLLRDHGHAGLALASSLSSLLTLLTLSIFFHRRNRSIPWGPFLKATARAVFSTLVSVAIVYQLLPASSLLSFSIACLVYLGACLLTLTITFSLELRETFQLVRRLSHRCLSN